MKHCSKCDRDLPKSNFYRATRNRDGLQSWCKVCGRAAIAARVKDDASRAADAARSRAYREAHLEERLAYGRAYNAANRDRLLAYSRGRKQAAAAWRRRKEYGLTPEQYDAMLEAQHGVCAICEWVSEDRALHVDHDHETGQIRGLLCGSCNQALGLMVDNAGLLLNAVGYLRMKR